MFILNCALAVFVAFGVITMIFGASLDPQVPRLRSNVLAGRIWAWTCCVFLAAGMLAFHII